MNWAVLAAKHGYFITTDNPLVREVNPKTVSQFYGDGGFLNKTAQVIFPLSPKRVLFMAWAPIDARTLEIERSGVDRINMGLAAQSDRFLYAHILDRRVSTLAARFAADRPEMVTEGFGPKVFAQTRVGR